jgi:hypothetical protein
MEIVVSRKSFACMCRIFLAYVNLIVCFGDNRKTVALLLVQPKLLPHFQGEKFHYFEPITMDWDLAGKHTYVTV